LSPEPVARLEPNGVADDDSDDEDGGPSMSLSALEEKLKPEVLARFEEIEVLYKKLHKMQSRRLETMTSGEDVTSRSEKSYGKSREELVQKVSQVRLHNNRIEELVTQLKQLNQRLTTLEGQSGKLRTMAGLGTADAALARLYFWSACASLRVAQWHDGHRQDERGARAFLSDCLAALQVRANPRG